MIIDEKRLRRQEEVIVKWSKNKYVGTFIGVTGCGKSYIAILSINFILSKKEDASVIVVVPTITLQEQWLSLLEKHNLPNVKVYVINTASKTQLTCDYLIVDELHTAGSNFFINLFETIKYKLFLGLTATIERSDGRHSLLLEKAPVFDEISLQEALTEGYISDYKVYNIPVEFTRSERVKYLKIMSAYKYYEFLLGGNLMAWENSKSILSEDLDKVDKVKRKNALLFLKLVNDRKQLLNTSLSKLDLAKKILDVFPDRKAILFCESIDFANVINKNIKNSLVYHSKLKKKEKLEIMKKYENTDSIMISCKALDAGLDIEGVNLGICLAGSSKILQGTQRLGRSIRRNKNNTIAYYFNIYVKDTQEEKWLNSRCYNMPNVYWIDYISQIN